MKKKAIVIGAGFSGIAAATSLAHEGFEVVVLEKHSMAGGRARIFQVDGFTFDMGPSWYWMPDVFENYFARFGKKTSDYYQLHRLNPSYTVVFGEKEFMHVPAGFEELCQMFESYEKGSSIQLKKFLDQASYKYQVGMNDLVHKPSRSITEFLSLKLLLDVLRMDVFTSIHKHIRKFFKNDKLIRLVEFPVLFLGAIPENTPALYSLMNYADMKLGTWYPMGGMHEIIKGMVKLAEEKGVKFLYEHTVEKFDIENDTVKAVVTNKGRIEADVIIGGADYHHIDTKLLPTSYRNYSDSYWEKRVMAPSSLIFYLGINKKLKNLHHHTLFFDEDLKLHAHEIYTDPQWPTKPLFYVSAPSITDKSVAPEGCENIFILIPVAPNLKDEESIREKYYQIVMDRLEKLTGQSIREAVIYKRSYAHKDFVQEYNAFKGNAYGLANTLLQTAILKPTLKNKKLKNLFYTGQLTTPGPGVPPSLISGQVVAKEIVKEMSNQQ
jgi:phytoene desaturase